MNILQTIIAINHSIDIPFTILFFAVGVFLTIRTGFAQFRAFPRFLRILRDGIKTAHNPKLKTLNSFQALFTAMATSIGIGNVVGPSLAIVIGGPGALFWLLLYAFFGAATKLVEVTFAVAYRTKTTDGRIFGGPAQYLRHLAGWLSRWYTFATILLFAGWSGIQAKALSEILFHEGIPEWITGLMLASLVFIILQGGAHRVAKLASTLVPLMFIVYVTAGLYILFSDIPALITALKLIIHCIWHPAASVGGFLGASILIALREGTYKGVFITESGMGTAAIPHSMADVARPIDQGILAMFSVAADSFLCLLSGLLIISSGIWLKGTVSNTLMLQVFTHKLPHVGPWLFITSIALFIISTAIGNSFNGSQSFATITYYKYMHWYYAFVSCVILTSTLIKVPLLWAIMDLIFPLVALPNLVGIVFLAIMYPEQLRYK